MHARVPVFRRWVEENLVGSLELLKNLIIGRCEKDEEYFKIVYEESVGKTLPKNIKPRDFFSGNYKIKILNNYLISMSLQQAPSIANVLYKMKWQFARIETEDVFITSDNPYTLRSLKTNRKSNFFGYGLLDNNIQVTLPLNSKTLLLMSWEGNNREKFIEINKKNITKINMQILEGADKFIISSTKNFAGSEYLNIIEENSRKY